MIYQLLPLISCAANWPIFIIAANSDYLKDQIPYHYQEYLQLVDWSGRAIREDKRGAIDDQLPSILMRLGINAEYWCKAMQPKANHQFSRALGCKHRLKAYAEKLGLGWIKGMSVCQVIPSLRN